MKLTLIILLFCLQTIGADAQTVFSGRIIDGNSKKVLGRASVVAESKEHKPVAFTQTKENGIFELKVPEGKEVSCLSVSLLGYAPKSINVIDFKNGQTIALHEEALMLKEVKATSKRLQQRSDTLVYSVAGFRHKQDRSIADVIAKMPGLEVRQDGSIYYQGKPINNFYIEGLNLMGNNYSQASENLNANKVKSVEVLTNHQNVKALRGVQFSDQAALNLVLEDDAKNTWLGLLEAGLGTTLQKSEADRLLRDGRLMAMMFGGKMQNLSMYKWNNTGKNIQKEVRDLQNTIDDISSTENMTSDVWLGAPGLKQERYTMNDSRLIATNWLFKTGKDANLRLQLNGFLDEMEGNRSMTTAYSDAMGGIIITEDANGEMQKSQWKGEMKYEYNGSQQFLTNVLSGYIDFNKSWASTLTNGILLRQEATPRKRWIGDNLAIVKTLGNDRILRLNVSGVISYLPGTLLLSDSTSQHIDQHDTRLHFSASFRHRLFKRFYISYKAGVDYNDERFNIHRGQEQAHDDNYQMLDCYLLPSLSIKRSNLEWQASLPVRVINRHFSDKGSTRLILTPMTSLRYQLTGRWSLGTSYSYNWQPASLEEMTAVPIYNSYRSYSTGFGKLFAENSHNGTVRLEYKDPIIGLFGHINGNLIYNGNMPLSNSQLDGILYHSSPSGESVDNTIWIISGRISKSLGTMKFIAALDGQLTSSHTTTMMNGRRLPFRYDSYRCGISFSLRPLQTLSFEEESRYQYNRQISTSDHSLGSRALRSFTHKLKTYYMPGHWQIEWTNEMYHSNDHSVSFTYFSDLLFSYRTKEYEVGVQIDNLFGNNKYEQHHISTYYTNYTVNRLRPREILFKASIDL